MKQALLMAAAGVAVISSLAISQQATFKASTNIVTVNISVTDSHGKPIENLTANDFELSEDGKVQKLQAVDFERLNGPAQPAPVANTPAVAGAPPPFKPPASESVPQANRFRNRRLMVMLFDFSSMQPAEQIRASEAATRFLETQMTAADLVSIEVYGSSLKTLQSFTDDRDLLLATIKRLRPGDSSENAATADQGADAQDTSGDFVADETEFNIFNADLKLAALSDAARSLGQYPEKKALIYISSGLQKSGVDNQSQLRATVNTAIRANVAFYPIDARGLSALVPGGDATQAGAAGNNLYSGAGQRSNKENFNNQQETLASLALDTGGKALLDSNDLGDGFRQVQSDFGSYYLLSYVSTNTAVDGRYRRIQVKLAPRLSGLHPKFDYRQGYYAPAAFTRLHESDKEAQLSEALLSGNPLTDLALAVEVDYFRLEKNKYFVPITAKIPGSALTFESKGSRKATALDFIAEVRDVRNRAVASVRDTIPLKLDDAVAGQVSQRSVQYDTAVTLIPGKYRLRFVARENGEGKTGTFETPFTVPDLAASGNALHVSSLVLSKGREALSAQVASVKNDRKVLAANPLLNNGQKLVPNVTKVFHPGDPLLAYLEVYDPKIPAELPETFRRPNVAASLALYTGEKKIVESKPVRLNQVSDLRPFAIPVSIDLPTASITPGRYDCQVNVIDEFGRRFAFPRVSLAIVR